MTKDKIKGKTIWVAKLPGFGMEILFHEQNNHMCTVSMWTSTKTSP